MRATLVYQSGQTYWEPWPSEFKIEVERRPNDVWVRFKSGKSKQSLGFAIPPDVAARLAQALLLACSGDVNKIVLPVKEE